MRTLITTLLALALSIAAGPAAASSSHTESCGNSVIRVGDPINKLAACGKPFRVVQLFNALGAPVGERWEFTRDTGMVLFVVTGGQVVRIERI